MKFIVKLEVNKVRSKYEVDLEDTGLSKEEWESLSADKQQSILQEIIDESYEQPHYWVVNWESK
jgi:hypothetical protein